jgi:hypothetical protein
MASLGQELLNVPMGQMIHSMATAISEGQWNLDRSSMVVAELMSGQRILRDINTGDLVNANPDGSPRIVDSRVHFGYTVQVDQQGAVTRLPQKVAMMELGFTPTFYQFVDTIIEVKITIKITTSTDQTYSSSSKSSDSSSSHQNNWSWGWGWTGWGCGWGDSTRTSVHTSQVDAAYSSKYAYSAEGASLLRTKLVPIPPPAILDERIREVMRIEKLINQISVLIDLKNRAAEADKAGYESQLKATYAQLAGGG